MSYILNNNNQKIHYKHIIGKKPGIIFIHGLNSDMTGQKAISIEKYAKKNKLNFIKFDCRGHGKSYGKFEDFTISDWKKDLLNIIDKIAKGPQILIGSSMGGWLMLLAAKARSARICGMIGLAAAPDYIDDFYTSLSKTNKSKLKKNGIIKYSSYGFTYLIRKKYIDDGFKNKILTKTFKWNKPLILIHGLKDKVVSEEVPLKILKKIKGNFARVIYLKNSDHSLSNKYDLKIINESILSIIKEKF